MVIRRMHFAERSAFVSHLLRLDKESRSIRWCKAMSDQNIVDYVDNLVSWPWVTIIGYYHKGTLRGCVEIHMDKTLKSKSAELAFSVEREFQSARIGTNLLQQALMFVRNRGLTHIVVNCRSSNIKMVKLIKKAFPIAIHREGDELLIEVKLANANLLTLWQEFFDNYLTFVYTPITMLP